MTRETRKRLLASLVDPDPGLDPAARTNAFREALLAFASETPDNTEAADRVAIGACENEQGRQRLGLIVRDTEYALSEIAYAIEDMSLPDEVREALPDLDEDEWDAATRVITLILSALEADDA